MRVYSSQPMRDQYEVTAVTVEFPCSTELLWEPIFRIFLILVSSHVGPLPIPGIWLLHAKCGGLEKYPSSLHWIRKSAYELWNCAWLLSVGDTWKEASVKIHIPKNCCNCFTSWGEGGESIMACMCPGAAWRRAGPPGVPRTPWRRRQTHTWVDLQAVLLKDG